MNNMNYNYSATHKFRLESVYRHHFRSEADVMVEGDVIHDVCRFSYDYNGNMTGIVTDRPAADGHTERRIAERKLLWDEENRLRAVDDNGFISCYFYDHTGRRTIKLTGGGRHTYVNGAADTDSTDTRNCTIYPGPNTVFSFSDGAYRQGQLSRHIYAGNERILTAVSLRKPVLTSASGTSRRPFEAQKDTLQSLVKQIYADCGVPFKGIDNTAPSVGPVVDAESVYFYHPDHLGSTTLLTDATGRPTQRVEYAPFGELFLDRRDGTTWHTPYLFNAKELDEETGLYYYGARYYDPHLSLWISPDPLERKYPAVSSYSYVGNNPTNYIDIEGFFSLRIGGNYYMNSGFFGVKFATFGGSFAPFGGAKQQLGIYIIIDTDNNKYGIGFRHSSTRYKYSSSFYVGLSGGSISEQKNIITEWNSIDGDSFIYDLDWKQEDSGSLKFKKIDFSPSLSGEHKLSFEESIEFFLIGIGFDVNATFRMSSPTNTEKTTTE